MPRELSLATVDGTATFIQQPARELSSLDAGRSDEPTAPFDLAGPGWSLDMRNAASTSRWNRVRAKEYVATAGAVT